MLGRCQRKLPRGISEATDGAVGRSFIPTDMVTQLPTGTISVSICIMISSLAATVACFFNSRETWTIIEWPSWRSLQFDCPLHLQQLQHTTWPWRAWNEVRRSLFKFIWASCQSVANSADRDKTVLDGGNRTNPLCCNNLVSLQAISMEHILDSNLCPS